MPEKRIFISFVEEFVLNPEYEGYIGGRIEVFYPGDAYQSEEIRFFTKKVSEFNAFRDKYDMKRIGSKRLKEIREKIEQEFTDL